MLILKVGGAIITDKSRGVKSSARVDEIKRIAKDIAENLEDRLILVHGVGSFGHPYVEEFKLKEIKNLRGIVRTHLECKKLNAMVCEALLEHGLNPYPIHPFTSFKIENGVLRFDHGLIERMLDEGFIPVVHGDMVFNITKRWFDVLSGDRIVVEFAKVFNAKRVGFATDREGIIVNGKVVREINRSNFDEVLKSVGGAEKKSDVTGGMKGKLMAISSLKAEVFVFHAKDIGRFLKYEHVGTLIRG